jgi:hypothetical protein
MVEAFLEMHYMEGNSLTSARMEDNLHKPLGCLQPVDVSGSKNPEPE